MSRRFKINTAILICSAFIFRLLVVNISVISSLSTWQNNVFIKNHYSTIIKRRRNFERVNNSKNSECLVPEICEVDPNNETKFKSKPFLLTQILYSLVANDIMNELKKIIPFYKHFSYFSSHRYLAFQVFRI
jgi:hypothetical protein